MARKTKVDSEIDGTLTIGNYTFNISDGSAGQTLKTDGAGNVTWADDISVETLAALTDVSGVTYAVGAMVVSNGVDGYTEQILSGDLTIDATGATTLAAGAVNLTNLADIPTLTVIGNVSGSTAAPAQVTIDIDLSTVPGDNSEIASSDAIKTYVDAKVIEAAGVAKYAGSFAIGDWAGSPLTFTILQSTHGLTSDRNLIVQVMEAGTPNLVVDSQIEISATGDVTLTTNTAFDGAVIIIG